LVILLNVSGLVAMYSETISGYMAPTFIDNKVGATPMEPFNKRCRGSDVMSKISHSTHTIFRVRRRWNNDDGELSPKLTSPRFRISEVTS